MFQGRMREGRWYPTTTTLPDGRVLITSGRMRDGSGNINEDVDVFTPNPDPTKRGTIADRRRQWLNLYPQQHVIRDGRVLVSGPTGVDVGIFNPANWGFSPAPAAARRQPLDGVGGAPARRPRRLEPGSW